MRAFGTLKLALGAVAGPVQAALIAHRDPKRYPVLRVRFTAGGQRSAKALAITTFKYAVSGMAGWIGWSGPCPPSSTS